MTPTDRFAAAVLRWLFEASWQLALLVALVAAAVWLLRGASPRLRHGLWLLVLVKALLPTSLATDWSIGRLGVGPAGERVATSIGLDAVAPLATEPASPPEGAALPENSRSTAVLALTAWAVGAVGVWAFVAMGYARLRRRVAQMPEVEEGPLAVALEEAALRVGVPGGVELRVDDTASSPYLLGVFRPRIVLPRPLADSLPPDELRGVLAHELLHWRRHDTWVGWLQAAVQGLFWFHPLVWWSAARLRHERECACDDAVLRHGASDPATYGDAIVHTLTAARGAAPPAAVLVGVFEHGSLLQQRLEEVMSYAPEKRRFGWASRLGLAAFALAALPMASQGTAAETAADETAVAETKRSSSPYPAIVKTVPEVGATDVDASLDEIRVTFDRDMTTGKHYSWTGGGEDFPYVDESREVRWVDSRTCALPVRLTKGKFYRVGINSTSFQNFKSADGKPAEHGVIAFVTEGAKRSVARKAAVPKVKKMTPENGATDVAASTSTISVTFDAPMAGGMSWLRTSEGAHPGAQNGRPYWSKDGRTCTMPVELQPGSDFAVGLNGSHYVNFQSKWGVPIEPVVWEFSTVAE